MKFYVFDDGVPSPGLAGMKVEELGGFPIFLVPVERMYLECGGRILCNNFADLGACYRLAYHNSPVGFVKMFPLEKEKEIDWFAINKEIAGG